MPKSIKPKDNTYIDSSGVSHNRTPLNNILDNINVYVANVNLSGVSVADTDDEKTVGTFTIPSTGVYLIAGYCDTNYYGQSGRDLFTYIRQNGYVVWGYNGVLNTDAWTVSRSVCCVINANKNDVITFTVKNGVAGKNYSFGGGKLQFVKLR